MVQLLTPYEITQSIVELIENERKRQGLRQSDLAEKANIKLVTYKSFIKKNDISLSRLIKIMYVLDMFDNLNSLIKEKEITTLEELKAKKKAKELPKRVKLSKSDLYEK
jgi:transcriptional regulator with XRE-family HTH domain